MKGQKSKRWDRCLYCDASIRGDDALVAMLHDPYCPHGKALAEVERLGRLINTPHIAEFLEAVKLEAMHQRERWATDHDAGKTDADWFWLVGYLAGKAVHSGTRAREASESDSVPDNQEAARPHYEKQVHHIITTAAALLNWHAARTGADTRMRPGIAPP